MAIGAASGVKHSQLHIVAFVSRLVFTGWHLFSSRIWMQQVTACSQAPPNLHPQHCSAGAQRTRRSDRSELVRTIAAHALNGEGIVEQHERMRWPNSSSRHRHLSTHRPHVSFLTAFCVTTHAACRITLLSATRSVTRSAPSCGQRHSRGEQSRAHHSRSQHAGRRCRVRGCAVQESEWWVWKIARVRCSSSHVHVRCAVPCRVDKHSRCERHPKIDSHHLWAHPDPVSVLCMGW